MDDFLEMRREQLELALLARFEPTSFRAGGRFRETRNQGDRCRDCVVTLTTHFSKIGNLPVDEALTVGLGTIQEARYARCGEKSVMLCLERGELFAANVRAASRHHHRGVPSEERERSPEGVKAFELLFELFVRRS
jgi:hypothetical protein